MADIGALSVEITADSSGLDRGVRQAESRLAQFSRSARTAINRMGQIGVAAGVAGAALMATMVRSTMSAVDEQAKLARSLDGSIDGLRGFQEAAQDAGVSASAASSSAQMLNARLGEAARGTGTAADSLDRLGLSARELMGMDVDERMAAIADAMRNKGFSAAQAQDELRQLGIRNRELATLMIQGGDAIRSARAEVDEFGLSINEVDAAQIEAANDAMRRIGRSLEVLRTRIAVALAPFLSVVADRINDMTVEAGGFRDIMDDAIENAARRLGFLADVIEGVRRTFQIAGRSIALVFLHVQEAALGTAEAIINGPNRAIQRLIQLINLLPGIDLTGPGVSELGADIQRELGIVRGAISEARTDIHDLLMEPLPSAGLDDLFADVEDRRREIAERLERQRDEEMQSFEDYQQAMADAEAQAELERAQRSEELARERAEEEERIRRQQMERRLEQIRESLMDEERLEKHRHEQRMEELREMEEEELLVGKEFDELKEALEAKHQARLTAITEDGEQERNKILGALADANVAIRENEARQSIAALSSGLQTMFGDLKQFGVALGVLKRLEAIASAYAWGNSIGGPPAGAAAAATAAAAGASTLSSLRSTSLSGGGGGGTSTPAAGSSTAPVSADGTGAAGGGGAPGGTLTVRGITPGSLFTGEAVAELAEELLDYQRRGGNVVLAG